MTKNDRKRALEVAAKLNVERDLIKGGASVRPELGYCIAEALALILYNQAHTGHRGNHVK